jgi:hypothetical protein
MSVHMMGQHHGVPNRKTDMMEAKIAQLCCCQQKHHAKSFPKKNPATANYWHLTDIDTNLLEQPFFPTGNKSNCERDPETGPILLNNDYAQQIRSILKT